MTREEFYGESRKTATELQLKRTLSPERDFGVFWREQGSPVDNFRLTWIYTTGEFYTFCHNTGDYRVLGSIEPLAVDKAEELLAGWTDVIHQEGSLGWVRERLGTQRRWKITLELEVEAQSGEAALQVAIDAIDGRLPSSTRIRTEEIR